MSATSQDWSGHRRPLISLPPPLRERHVTWTTEWDGTIQSASIVLDTQFASGETLEVFGSWLVSSPAPFVPPVIRSKAIRQVTDSRHESAASCAEEVGCR